MLSKITTAISSASPIQAMWGKMIILPPGKADIVSAGSWDGHINWHSELDTQQEETVEAQNQIRVTDEEKAKSFSLTLLVNEYASGQSPINIHQRWLNELGKKNLFFIGLIPLGKTPFILEGVELAFNNSDIAAGGAAFQAQISLSFLEDVIIKTQAKKQKEENKTAKSAKSAGVKKAAKKAEAEASSKSDLKKLAETTPS